VSLQVHQKNNPAKNTPSFFKKQHIGRQKEMGTTCIEGIQNCKLVGLPYNISQAFSDSGPFYAYWSNLAQVWGEAIVQGGLMPALVHCFAFM
jgi:hypothetical protein